MFPFSLSFARTTDPFRTRSTRNPAPTSDATPQPVAAPTPKPAPKPTPTPRPKSTPKASEPAKATPKEKEKDKDKNRNDKAAEPAATAAPREKKEKAVVKEKDAAPPSATPAKDRAPAPTPTPTPKAAKEKRRPEGRKERGKEEDESTQDELEAAAALIRSMHPTALPSKPPGTADRDRPPGKDKDKDRDKNNEKGTPADKARTPVAPKTQRSPNAPAAAAAPLPAATPAAYEDGGEGANPHDLYTIPNMPMVERPGGLWYRANVVKETSDRVLFEWAGYESAFEREWVERASTRIWRGSYKTKDWRYKGQGAWEPKGKPSSAKPPKVTPTAATPSHTHAQTPATEARRVPAPKRRAEELATTPVTGILFPPSLATAAPVDTTESDREERKPSAHRRQTAAAAAGTPENGVTAAVIEPRRTVGFEITPLDGPGHEAEAGEGGATGASGRRPTRDRRVPTRPTEFEFYGADEPGDAGAEDDANDETVVIGKSRRRRAGGDAEAGARSAPARRAGAKRAPPGAEEPRVAEGALLLLSAEEFQAAKRARGEHLPPIHTTTPMPSGPGGLPVSPLSGGPLSGSAKQHHRKAARPMRAVAPEETLAAEAAMMSRSLPSGRGTGIQLNVGTPPGVGDDFIAAITRGLGDRGVQAAAGPGPGSLAAALAAHGATPVPGGHRPAAPRARTATPPSGSGAAAEGVRWGGGDAAALEEMALAASALSELDPETTDGPLDRKKKRARGHEDGVGGPMPPQLRAAEDGKRPRGLATDPPAPLFPPGGPLFDRELPELQIPEHLTSPLHTDFPFFTPKVGGRGGRGRGGVGGRGRGRGGGRGRGRGRSNSTSLGPDASAQPSLSGGELPGPGTEGPAPEPEPPGGGLVPPVARPPGHPLNQLMALLNQLEGFKSEDALVTASAAHEIGILMQLGGNGAVKGALRPGGGGLYGLLRAGMPPGLAALVQRHHLLLSSGPELFREPLGQTPIVAPALVSSLTAADPRAAAGMALVGRWNLTAAPSALNNERNPLLFPDPPAPLFVDPCHQRALDGGGPEGSQQAVASDLAKPVLEGGADGAGGGITSASVEEAGAAAADQILRLENAAVDHSGSENVNGVDIGAACVAQGQGQGHEMVDGVGA